MVAVVTVLGISLVSGLTSTRDLLIDKATSAMDAAREDLTDLLDPAEEQVRYIAELIYSRELDETNSDQLADFLLAALAGTPQVNAITFISADLKATSAKRLTGKVVVSDATADPLAAETMNEISGQESASWGPLFYVPQLKDTVFNFRQPIFRDDKFIGAVITTISVAAMNEDIKESLVLRKGTRFILYGTDRVLLQQNVEDKAKAMSGAGTVAELANIGDPILKNIWSPDRHALQIIGNQTEFTSHHLTVDGNGYLFFYINLPGYSDKDLIVGYWIKNEDAIAEIRRLGIAGLAGLAILVISGFIAVMIGRRISKPILALSVASRQISKLEFKAIAALPASRFTEVNEANDAYNTMLRGLSWFETYVPKTLVRKLIESGEAISEQRIVTVMFTDIVNFTPQAEGMSSGEVANFLNSHFRLVTSCIEAEGGTVDKFIGDAVMAFWGAPDLQPDHAARACRAALAIKAIIITDNEERKRTSLSPVKMRIGIHTGPLVVGNIGSAGRSNYTVVGDTVNIAQRMEQYGKILAPDQTDAVLTLITDATCDAAGPQIKAEKIGDYKVKGREDEVKIYRLT